ncbi:hypothetical protein IWQ57_003314 [Coemansia nantahalensis]|uniref:Uncharacterized protein n=2 Tax=Coemansia TaxID=4863 RepID=A0ACC1KWR2_9FUNG|nr:hypothetical protein IWQ57_003314 [Coemansia nantahalensis]KAJ2796852.1 hypothetical protein H4R21_004550 [Coemansia helicoidea]
MAQATERALFDAVLRGFQVSSLAIAGSLLVTGSPYGSQTNYRGRLAVNGRVAWIAMELVSPAMLLYAYLGHPARDLGVVPAGGPGSESAHSGLAAWRTARGALVLAWLVHYVYRALVYPLQQQARKPMHLGIALSAVVFNTVNGYLNGRWLAAFAPAELGQPFAAYVAADALRRSAGLALFAAGLGGNIYHDSILTGLSHRQAALQTAAGARARRYAVPHGGLFALVSCPHYLCELAEWLGYALVSGSPAAWTFLLNAACNLVPRARLIHRWYRTTFAAEYPTSRTAIIPFLF